MKCEKVTFTAPDGFTLAGTLFAPATYSDVRRVVLVAPAMAVKRGYYERFARFLAERGFTAFTFDYRGVGESRPPEAKEFQAFMHQWGEEDIAGAMRWLHRRFPSHPMMAVGHSAGGQLIGIAEGNHRLRGLVTVASPSGYWRLWPWPRRYAMAFLWSAAVPAITSLYGYFPGARIGLGEDLPAGVAREWAAWGRDPEYLAGRSRRPSVDRFDCVNCSVLSYSFSDDHYAPRIAVDWMTGRYRAAHKERRHVTPREIGQPIRHFGFFRDRLREPLWVETASWLMAC